MKICHWKFENISIISQVICEKTGFGGYFEFLRPYRKLNFRTYIFYKSLPSILKIYHLNFGNISISSQVIGEKPVFGDHFEFLRPNQKYNFKIKAAVPYSRTNLIICRLNFKNISISSQVSGENRFSAAILKFSEQTGSSFWEPKFSRCECSR